MPGARQKEVGKGVAHHKHPWNKFFYLLKQQWGSRGRGRAGGTQHGAAAVSGVVLEPRLSLGVRWWLSPGAGTGREKP